VRQCQITDEVGSKIFSPFTFETSLLELEHFGKFRYHVIVGGRLNADQARSVASVLNTAPEMRAILTTASGISSGAYIARMRTGK
jgi:hypothetical protein